MCAEASIVPLAIVALALHGWSSWSTRAKPHVASAGSFEMLLGLLCRGTGRDIKVAIVAINNCLFVPCYGNGWRRSCAAVAVVIAIQPRAE